MLRFTAANSREGEHLSGIGESETGTTYLAEHRAEFVAGLKLQLQAGYYCRPHAHAVLEIVYHSRGKGTTTMGTYGAYTFVEGSVVIYPPQMPHDQYLETAGEDCCVMVAFPDGIPAPLTTCGYIPSTPDPMVRSDLYHLSQARLPATPLLRLSLHARVTAVIAWIIHTMTTTLTIPAKTCDAVEQAYQFLQREHSHALCMDEVARHVGLSESYLRHQFKRQYGKSLVQCLTEIRVARACDLLRHTRLPLEEIARLCGFDNERYFSTVFRRVCQCPPGRYRRQRSMIGDGNASDALPE